MSLPDQNEVIHVFTYVNPVHPRDFPDPFILRYKGKYYAVCTGFWKDGRVFGIMRSTDLIHWEELQGAMEPLTPFDPTIPYTCYWAPEIYRFGETFYLYYSVGNETWMHIRVAIADHPAGPYTDSGHILTREQFAIDPHVFMDDDGQHYLFYATDFLDYSYIGTGTVRDRLIEPRTLADKPQPVTRANYDWQVYDPNRKEKGGVRWHTVEGPFVLKRKGIYYEMFSGGNWQNTTYGVSFASTRDINAPGEWQQHCDGTTTLPILRTINADDGRIPVIGPGHNSVIEGPTSLEQYCIYHQWNKELTSRVLSIDRMDFVGKDMIVLGPTTELQEAPAQPSISLLSPTNQMIDLSGQSFIILAEINLKTHGHAELIFLTQSEQLRLRIEQQRLTLVRVDETIATLDLPLTIGGFTASTAIRLNLIVNHRSLELTIEGQSLIAIDLPKVIVHVELINERSTLAHIELSYGWEDRFENDDLATIGWIESSSETSARIENGELRLVGERDRHVLVKATGSEDYELVVNVRLISCDLQKSSIAFGVYPCLPDTLQTIDTYPLIALKRLETEGISIKERWTLQAIAADFLTVFTLPEDFNPTHYNQLRFRKRGSNLHLLLGKDEIGTLDVPTLTRNVGLYANGCEVAVEMVRLISYS